jgi:hypothetical protein
MANAISNAVPGCTPERESTRKKFGTTHGVDGMLLTGRGATLKQQGNAERWR